jgi:hypothetical protein
MAHATVAIGSLAATLEFTPGKWASLIEMLPIALASGLHLLLRHGICSFC